MSVGLTSEKKDTPCYILDMGFFDYAEAHKLQIQLTRMRLNHQIGDILILLEHPPVFTLGRHHSGENILASPKLLRRKGVEVYHTDRGGDVTYHGPGQVVGYPIIEVRNRCRRLTDYVNKLEEVIILVLKDLEIKGERIMGQPGVWVGGEKIASIGVAVKDFRVAYHGFSLNVNPDISYFEMINPCGIKNVKITSLVRILGRNIETRTVKEKIIRYFGEIFGVKMRKTRPYLRGQLPFSSTAKFR